MKDAYPQQWTVGHFLIDCNMSMLLLAILPLVAFGYVQDADHSHRLVACMQLTRHVLMTEQRRLEKLTELSHFGKEDVMTKVMAEMLTQCIDTIPIENTKEIIYAQEDSPILSQFTNYVQMPEYPYLTEDAIKLTENEAEIITEILEKTKKAEEAKKRGEVQQEFDDNLPVENQSFGTSLGLVYIIVVFCAFAGCVGYGLMRMESQKVAKKGKKKLK